jgi:hypothetical protein
MRKLGEQWRELSFEKKLSIVVVPVALAIISGVLVPILNRQTEKSGKGASASSPTTNLEVVDLAVSGGVQRQCLSDPPARPQTIDLTVRNTGDMPSLVKRIVFRVTAFGRLTTPGGIGGGLEPSKNYDVVLPPDPRIGQTLTYKVSQRIPPRDVDRFTIKVDLPEPVRSSLEFTRLYHLDVMLLHDTETAPTEAGKVLVSAPFLPEKSMFWAGIAPIHRSGYKDFLGVFRENEKVFRRMFSLAGERSPELSLDLVDVPITNKEDAQNPCAPPSSSSG